MSSKFPLARFQKKNVSIRKRTPEDSDRRRQFWKTTFIAWKATFVATSLVISNPIGASVTFASYPAAQSSESDFSGNTSNAALSVFVSDDAPSRMSKGVQVADASDNGGMKSFGGFGGKSERSQGRNSNKR